MRRLTGLTLAAMLAACAPAQDGPRPMTRDQALLALQAEELPVDERVAAAYGLGRAIEQGDYAAWQRARAVIESESAPDALRSVLVWVFAEKADERIAREMLALAIGWNALIEAHRARAATEEEREAWRRLPVSGLLSTFLYRFDDTPLAEFVPRDERALDLVEPVVLRGRLFIGGSTAISTILLESGAPAQRVSETTTRLILSDAVSGGASLATLLTPADRSQLRQTLAASGSTADTMHWNAMMALAYTGNIESRELFLAKKRAMDQTDTKQAQMIRYYLWQIEVQNPPEGLLEHIAQPTDRTVPHDRDWAMRRAVERGLPREDIRDALFTFAETVEPERRKDARSRWHTVWPELYAIKASAVKLGLIGRDELPHIPYSDEEPMP